MSCFLFQDAGFILVFCVDCSLTGLSFELVVSSPFEDRSLTLALFFKLHISDRQTDRERNILLLHTTLANTQV